MGYYFSVCSTHMYQFNYIDFVLEHYRELNLPYAFPAALSYIASPLLMESEPILGFDDEDQVVGALGYIHGTGENNYADRHIVQLQAAYIVERHRRTGLFVQGLQFLLQHLALQEEKVEELRFWTENTPSNRRLYTKFAKRFASADNDSGSLDAYRVSTSELQAYLAKFRLHPFI